MYETNKLRGRIVEKFGTQSDFAKAANCPLSFVSQYMNGKKKLSQPRMDMWIKVLDISAEEIPEYFFTHRVDK